MANNKPAMPAGTLAALKGSEAKWVAVVDGTGTDMGWRNCALCEVFISSSNACAGCPVAKETGQGGCHGSPYEEWADHQREDHEESPLRGSVHSGCRKCKRLAQAELDFLRSLLPEEV
jgi:hypothetical protein